MGDTVLDTAMVDTVARDPLPLKLPQKLMLKPGTVTLDTDTVPDTELELTDTVPDTVERDPLMPGTDAVMVVMVDTPVDTEVTDTAVDTDTNHLSSQLTKETILYKIMPL